MRIPLYFRTDVDRKFKYTPGIPSELLKDIYYLPHPDPEFYLGLAPGESFEMVFSDYDPLIDNSYYFPIIISLSSVLNIMEHLVIADDVMNDILKGKCKILISCPYEGWDWRYFRKFPNEIKKNYPNLSLDHFVFLTGNYSNQEDLNQVYFNSFERNIEHVPVVAYRHRAAHEISTKKKKPYKFICLNRRPDVHRFAIVTDLWEYKDVSLMSLGNKGHAGTSSAYFDNAVINFKEKYPDLFKKYLDNKIDQLLPLKINDGIDASIENPVNDRSIDKFYNSYIHIITETFSEYKFDRLFFSEKVYKPIMFMQPFVLIAEPYALKALKELGYKTFSEFWDESYDDVLNDNKRFKMASAVIKELAAKPQEELAEMLVKMLPILNHNIGNLLYRAHTMDVNLIEDLNKFLTPVKPTKQESKELRVQRKQHKRLKKQGRKD
jgi:hypothetical protein